MITTIALHSRRALCLLAPLPLAFAAPGRAQQINVPTSLAIVDVSVVDVSTGSVAPAQDVVIVGNRITAVAPSHSLPIPPDTRRIDGRGMFVIPGLWDMHVHLGLAGRSALALLVANGVTGVRDMGDHSALVRAWSDSTASGAIIGPHIELVSMIVEDGRWLELAASVLLRLGDWTSLGELRTRVGVSTIAEAHAVVERAAASGLTLIKVRNSPPPAAYFTLLHEAKLHGLRVVGHAPSGVSLLDASDSGQASIEHSLVERVNDQWRATLDAMSDSERQTLLSHFARNQTALDPTLIADVGYRQTPDSTVIAIIDNSPAVRDSLRRYLDPALAASWRTQIEMKQFEGPQPDWRSLTVRAARHLADAHAVGVPIFTGTDLGAPLVYPGFSLHDELARLVSEGGLTPLEALRAATIAPAQFFRREAEWGNITTGKIADLVLLRANPLADIHNTSSIVGVVANGRYFDRTALMQERR